MRNYFKLLPLLFSFLFISPLLGKNGFAANASGTPTGATGVVLPSGLSADLDNALDDINDTFLTTVAPWTSQARTLAERIFLMLIGLDFAWMIIQALMKNGYIDDVMRQLVTKVLMYGIGWYLIFNGDALLRNIFDFFIEGSETVADKAMNAGAGASSEINVGNFFDKAITTISNLYSSFLKDTSINGVDTLVAGELGKLGLIIGMTIMIAYICATILVAYAEMYMTITAAIVLFGFFVTDMTREISQKAIMHTIAMGFKLFGTLLIGRICITMVQQWIKIATNGSFMDMITMFSAMFVFALLLAHLPKVLGAIVSITSIFSPGDGIATALRGVGARIAIKEPAAMVGVLGNAALTARASGAKGLGAMASTTARNLLGAYGTVLKAKATTGRSRELQERSTTGAGASHALHQARIDMERGRADKG